MVASLLGGDLSDMTMKIDGACHCGYLTFEAEVAQDNVLLCHCTDCQALSASAFRIVVRSTPDSVRLISGEPSTYSKVGSSGAERVLSFCPKCGTNIFSTTAGEGPKIHSIRVGAVSQRSELIPVAQQWTQSAQPWLDQLEEFPKFRCQAIL